MISILIPARNESENIESTVSAISAELERDGLDYEIIVVNDNSSDNTFDVVQNLGRTNHTIRAVNNDPPFGIGSAITKGLDMFRGDGVIIVMADASDDPKDVVKYAHELRNGCGCCFGSRWGSGSEIQNYPFMKWAINRLANRLLQLMFWTKYNDITNAFKGYSKETVAGIRPIRAQHFNITVELPLRAMIRGYPYTILPTGWRQRTRGKTNFRFLEMIPEYFLTIVDLLFERMFGPKPKPKSTPPVP